MDAGEDLGLTPRAKRALPLIGAALAVIVVASLLYLRASGPRPPVTLSVPPSISVLASRYQPTYDFLTPSLGWAAVLYQGLPANTFWVFETTDGAKHWKLQLSGATQGGDVALQFFNRSMGLVTFGYNGTTFFRTHDGGTHWDSVDEPSQTVAMGFADADHGWALTAPDPMGPPTHLAVTADGGDTWTAATWPPGSVWGGKGGGGPLAVRPSGEGWLGAEGANPVVFTTGDQGTTWAAIPLPAPAVTTPAPPPKGGFEPIQPAPSFSTEVDLLPGAGVLVFVTDYFGNTTPYASFDRGQNWRVVTAPPSPATFDDVSFQDSRHWWAVRTGFVFKTADSGQSWHSVNVVSWPDNWDFEGSAVIDARHAWAVIASSNGSIGGTALAMTSDGGANWTTVAVPQPV